MLNLIACFKWVVDEAYLRPGPGGTLDFSAVDSKISDYDRCAIEEAVRLRERHGGVVTAVTVGPPAAAKALKDALSRGPDRACFVSDPSFEGLEPSQTAAILADAIRSRLGPYDLILCGEGSSDLYSQQVGIRLGEELAIPTVGFVERLTIEDGSLVAERRVEGGVEVVEAPLPALVTVLPDINRPRIPGVKDTLQAAKKEVLRLTKDLLPRDYAPLLETRSLRAASLRRTCEKLLADPAGIARFARVLLQQVK